MPSRPIGVPDRLLRPVALARLSCLLVALLAAFLPASVAASALTLEDIFLEKVYDGSDRPEVTWIEAGRAVVVEREEEDGTRSWERVDPRTGGSEAWWSLAPWEDADGETVRAEGLIVGPDDTTVLVPTRPERRWRRSVRAEHWVFDRERGGRYRLSDGGPELHPAFSPDGGRIAYVRDGDLFVHHLDDGRDERITRRTSEEVSHGDPDWVYEEEFDFHEAFWWSPDSARIAFLRFDRTGVGRVPLVRIGEEAMPTVIRVDYPKAGARNSQVSLHVADLRDGAIREIARVDSESGYLVRVHWAPGGDELLHQVLDRDQRRLRLLASDPRGGGRAREVLVEHRSEGWVEVDDDLHLLDDGWLLWTSRRDGWRHVYRGHLDGRDLEQLTSGRWEVRSIAGASREHALLLTHRTRPVDRNVDRLDLRTGALERIGPDHGWSSLDVNQDASSAVHRWSTVERRPLTEWIDAGGGRRAVLQEDPMEDLTALALAEVRLEQLDLPTAAHPWTLIMRPADFDASRAHPVLVHVYGGPGAQLVRDAWSGRRGLFHHFLVQQGWVVVMADGRGSGGRGANHEHAVDRRLGGLEIEDQLAVVDHLRTRSWVDPERIAIWGSSYGGYVSAAVLLRGAGRVAAAVAVAPVTDWRFYDTGYTERFMGMPVDNPVGYEKGSLLPLADRLEGALLLVHGTGDDNVHVQNTYRLADALVEAEKDFDLMLYPDQAHSLSGGKTQYDLYRRGWEHLRAHVRTPRTQRR